MQQTKKQHYVPQHYLRSFGVKGDGTKIWSYDLQNLRFFKDSVVNTAHQNYFYAFERDDGTRDTQTVERWLAEQIEGPAISSLDKIRHTRPISLETLDHESKEKLTLYINFLLKRVPKFREKSRAIIPEVIEDFRKKIDAGEFERIQSEEERRMAIEIMNSYADNVPSKFLIPSSTGLVANAIFTQVAT